MLGRQIHLERGLFMDIISKLHQLIHQTGNLIELEESVRLFMYDVFATHMGEVFTKINNVIVKEKQQAGWTIERSDPKNVLFTFGWVRFSHTLMHDPEGHAHYPFDEQMGFKKHKRRSPLVDVKVAEMASEVTYRETEAILKQWTAVDISHTTVGTIVKEVGETQSKHDEEMVTELEEAAELPKGKEVDYLYAEADGVFVRSTAKKKSHEVRHAITYEGWDKNGDRVSLRHPKVMMTTQPMDDFWNEVQTFTAHHYMLDHTQVVTNSDGGAGYTADKFQEAFSQSHYRVLNQLDAYHVFRGLNRALGAKQSDYKDGVRKALESHNLDDFTLWLDSYESTLEDDKKLEKVKDFRTYINRNWERIIDWRECVENPPQDARSLGAMESNQRHVTYRMKKRGMHWSQKGAEAMVKIKQGILNGTLRDVYLKDQRRTNRKQREIKRTVKKAQNLHQPTRPSIGAKQGTIGLYAAHSSPLGKLKKSLQS